VTLVFNARGARSANKALRSNTQDRTDSSAHGDAASRPPASAVGRRRGDAVSAWPNGNARFVGPFDCGYRTAQAPSRRVASANGSSFRRRSNGVVRKETRRSYRRENPGSRFAIALLAKGGGSRRNLRVEVSSRLSRSIRCKWVTGRSHDTASPGLGRTHQFDAPPRRHMRQSTVLPSRDSSR